MRIVELSGLSYPTVRSAIDCYAQVDRKCSSPRHAADKLAKVAA